LKFDPQKHQRRSMRLSEYDYSQAGAYFVTICTWDKTPLFGEICEGEMRLSAAGRIVKAEWKRLAHQFTNIRLNAFVVMPNHVHGIIVIDDPVGATRHLSDDALSGVEAGLSDALDVPDGSPLRGGEGGEAGDFDMGDGRATRHSSDDDLEGVEPGLKDVLEIPDGSPLQIDTHAGVDGSPAQLNRLKGPAKGSLGAMIGQFKSRATKKIWSLPEYDHIPIWQRNYYEHVIRDREDYESIWAYIQTNPLRWVEDQLHPRAAPNPFNQG
jgi:putative transposase